MDKTAAPTTLDTLLTQLGLSNADLVKISTDQLTFKMVHKGRMGRRLTPNVQEKIHNALIAVKPELKIRRRDLFRYEPSEAFIAGIAQALTRVQAGEVRYPEFIDLLAKAGVVAYSVEVGSHCVTYFGAGGEAHTEQGPVVRSSAPGAFNETSIRAAIAGSQKALIDYPTFLRRIHEAGIAVYEVNVRNRKIVCKGEELLYRESIPVSGQESTSVAPKAPEKNPMKALAKKKTTLNKQKSKTRKARLNSNKRWRQRRKARSGR